MHKSVWAALRLPSLLLVFAMPVQAVERLTFPTGTQAFSPDEVQFGSETTKAECNALPHSVWVQVDGRGDCIRYYAAGLRQTANPEILLYMHGDRMEGA